MSKTALNLTTLEITRQVSIAWGNAFNAKNQYRLYNQLDSIFQNSERAAKLRFETQAISRLEYLSVSNQARQISIQKEKTYRDYLIALRNLNQWFVSDTVFTINDSHEALFKEPQFMLTDSVTNHPLLQLYNQNITLAEARTRLTSRSSSTFQVAFRSATNNPARFVKKPP